MPAPHIHIPHLSSLLIYHRSEKICPTVLYHIFGDLSNGESSILLVIILLLPTLRSAHILLLLVYHKKFMLSIFRSAEVPFLNIISYLIQFVKFRSICAFQRTRGVCSICAEGQCVLICEALEELHLPRTSAYDSRSVVRSAGPDPGFGIQGN